MQDRYTGDVGDFGKYGLLRCLRGHDAEALGLGVIWYRPNPATVERDSHNDGKHTTYLRPNKELEYRPCDEPLYDALREIVSRNDRRVQAVEQSGLLGNGTQFFSDYIPGPATASSDQAKVRPRRLWAEQARLAAQNCDLVFLDPDNGLEVQSKPKTEMEATKYVYFDEAEALFGRSRSLVIYQHLDRSGKAAEQFRRRRNELQQRLQPADIFALRFRRGTSRFFFIVATEEHAPLLRERTDALLQSPWGKREHFTPMS